MTAVLDVPRPVRWYTEPEHVEVGGTTLAVRQGGSGEPVLLLHGHFATRRWTPFHAALAERFHVVAPEAPGFGQSPSPAWVTGRDDVVLLYRELLDVLGLDAVHVVGYGLGAWLAADLAVWNPTRVRSLSVLAPFGLRVVGSPVADVFVMDPARFPEAYYGGEPGELADVVPGVGTPAEGGPEEFAHRYGEMGAAARLMWQRRYDLKLEHRLPALGLPALVVGGAEDRIVPGAHLDAWAGLLGARVETLPGAPHAFPLTEPERTAETVAAFLEATGGEGTTR